MVIHNTGYRLRDLRYRGERAASTPLRLSQHCGRLLISLFTKSAARSVQRTGSLARLYFYLLPHDPREKAKPGRRDVFHSAMDPTDAVLTLTSEKIAKPSRARNAFQTCLNFAAFPTGFPSSLTLRKFQ